jgi:transposase
MLGHQPRPQPTLFIPGSIDALIPDDHILKRVDRILDVSWLRGVVAEEYSLTQGRPSIDPEAAVRLMLAGFFHGIVHDRKLLREAQVNLAIRWFAGYRLDEALPDHSSLTRIRQRWGRARSGSSRSFTGPWPSACRPGWCPARPCTWMPR